MEPPEKSAPTLASLGISKKTSSRAQELAAVPEAEFEAAIAVDGCRDPLVIWRGLLLDGHNRNDICARRGVAFETTEVDLPDRDAAIEWIIRNQFGRRNITVYARAELALKLEPIFAKRAKAAQKKGGKEKVPQKSSEAKSEKETRQQVAKVAGVSHDTIGKAKLVRDNAAMPVAPSTSGRLPPLRPVCGT